MEKMLTIYSHPISLVKLNWKKLKRVMRTAPRHYQFQYTEMVLFVNTF